MTGRARNPHHVIADVSFREGAVKCSCSWRVHDEGTPEQVAEAYRQHRLANGLALPGPSQANRAGVWR